MPDTHCLPTGSLGTGELPVPNVNTGVIGVIPATTGVGNRRGVVVNLSGLSGVPVVPPAPSGEFLTFCNDLAADGWTVLSPPYAEQFYDGLGYMGIYNDILNDAGNGSRYLNMTLRWWDHVIIYCQKNYPGWPVVVFGGSWGGWHALQLAANKTSTMIAFAAWSPSTLTENINSPILTGGTTIYGLLNSSGQDIAPTLLNSVTIPGTISYGTQDLIVGYGGTSTYTGSTINVSTISNISLGVASTTGYFVGPNVTVTGLTGGTGRCTFTFTGTTGGNTLTGCTLISGSGSLTNGLTMTQSNTLALIAAQNAAQPSHQITGNSTTDYHFWLPTDTTYFTGWFTSTADPLAPKVF